ncbi:hypothetical protein EV383_1051 [Pseudonocardia sediminis]|uniref:ParE-like toxin of type II ParDE toxin-antitoxin system n=1 Tax=Pseudonocardia sediminis TaxID=1397368 RepID=A0A4Q7UVS8_PSEST|nr:hypothetical protein [Pseudonocardia sediminis]RZT84213.1 hypothetical protein EV383_1051 [Pseudonocardia sediminis]
MTYALDIDPAAHASIDVLPHDALAALAEAFTLMTIDPWLGPPVDAERNPDGPVRNLPFGTGGIITYLILERDHRVDVVLITWTG